MTILLLALGLTLLLVGGELLVRGAVTAARAMGISPLLVGLTIVGFGTSMPELVASLEAALIGSPGIAIGNVVGSNIANILLILGLTAAIMPLAADRRAFLRDGPALLGASLVLLAVCQVGALSRLGGLLLVGLLFAYIVYSYVSDRRLANGGAALHAAEAESVAPLRGPLWLTLLLLALGLAGVVFGADLLIGAAVDLARRWGLSETVIGLTLVAVGTSLPELVTSIMAALRRQPDVALGNVIGSNIFNALGILGATALVQPLSVPPEIARLDGWVMIGSAALLATFGVTGWRIRRWEGLVLLFGYVAYLAVLLSPPVRLGVGSP